MGKRPPSAASKLETYRAKRSAGATPEPFGREGVERPGLFVVQKHAARNLHYDLRIEIGGVLRSWAVPKGPSFDPADKRFAVETEDHPLEYADFEGVIPAGNYGAGAMIVWDRGLCVPRIDHREGLEKGKLLFELRGYKLRGLWTLVKTKGARKWLLIKERDGWASDQRVEDLGAESVFSGLTVEELRDGHSKAKEVRRRLEELGAPRRAVDPERVKVMLAELRREPFTRPGWIFELKYDGYRLVAAKREQVEAVAGPGPRPRGVRFFFRSGTESTVSFPDLARALRSLPFGSLVLDGEVVVLDEEARPSFERLQKRGRISRPLDAERAAIELPAVYYAFDLLGFEGYDLRPLPLSERKQILQEVLPRAGPLRYTDHVEERGEDLYQAVRAKGLEGIMAKRADSPYRPGRSAAWLKVRADRVGDYAVIGFTPPQGGRPGFGALHLGVLEGPHFVYAGRVGSGFSDAQLTEMRARLDADRRPDPPAEGAVPKSAGDVWVEPKIVVEVRYTDVTESGQLRHPVFLSERTDLGVEDCVRAGVGPQAGDSEPAEPMPRPEVPFTRLDKVFWPAEGHTKGDLIDYYRSASRWLLPYLTDRPVVLDRYPDGIEGKNFYQKNAPDFAPDWIRTERIWHEKGAAETEYFVCDDSETLLYLANLGAIPLHVWSSRFQTLQAPDWTVLDLDAKEASFAHVVEVARAIHALCEAIELPSFVKTSGATGLHVLIPLGGKCTYAQSRQLAEVVSRVMSSELPEIATIARAVAKRKGRVYLDYLQNGYGKLIVAPFSVRPLPGAPVSTPLAWSEVEPGLDPGAFTIETVPERLQSLGEDPLAPVLALEPELPRILARLAQRL